MAKDRLRQLVLRNKYFYRSFDVMCLFYIHTHDKIRNVASHSHKIATIVLLKRDKK